jgi:hypothetical protein
MSHASTRTSGTSLAASADPLDHSVKHSVAQQRRLNSAGMA